MIDINSTYLLQIPYFLYLKSRSGFVGKKRMHLLWFFLGYFSIGGIFVYRFIFAFYIQVISQNIRCSLVSLSFIILFDKGYLAFVPFVQFYFQLIAWLQNVLVTYMRKELLTSHRNINLTNVTQEDLPALDTLKV